MNKDRGKIIETFYADHPETGLQMRAYRYEGETILEPVWRLSKNAGRGISIKKVSIRGLLASWCDIYKKSVALTDRKGKTFVIRITKKEHKLDI